MRRLDAAWVLPVSAPPIRNGAVLVDDNGRIAAVGPAAAVPDIDCLCQSWPDAVIVPGLVNTHTHLELTGFAGLVDDDDFWEWIKHIIALKSARSDEDFFNASLQGIRDCWAGGVTTVCDLGNSGQVVAALDHLGASGVAHHEVFDMHTGEPDQVMRRFAGELEHLAPHAVGRVSLGVSPHAPYTVSGAVYRATGELARAHGVPIAVHIAEPPDESALLRDFTGTFAEALRARGVARLSQTPTTPVAWLDQHGILSPRTICAHAIHTDLADTELLVRQQTAIAHCPRSNRRHHRADAPVARYVDAGLRMGLGTDSEASVAPLDLLAEARAARTLTGWSAQETLRALTLGGAEALGMEGAIGSLAPGKWADLAVIRVAAGEREAPEDAILATSSDDVLATWLNGRTVFAAEPEAAS
jgi:cytosine/adenosine deaminase-related metal-dependent hydrolase